MYLNIMSDLTGKHLINSWWLYGRRVAYVITSPISATNLTLSVAVDIE